MADETTGLKPRPEFGEGIFEGPPAQDTGAQFSNAEPEPGTPAFGERAKQRAFNQSPDALTARSGLTPTAAELAVAPPTPDEAPASVVSGQPGAQLGGLDANALKMFDVPPLALDALLNDQTPVNESAPEDDIIKRLSDSLLGPPDQIPQPRGFTPGEHLALGIMGALDPEMFQNVVLPMLQMEKNAPRQAALDMEAQKQHRAVALQALATLMSSKREHEATIQEARTGHRLEAAQMAQTAAEANANRRLRLYLAQQRERAKSAAATKVGDRIFGTYMLSVTAFQDALRMKKILDNNPSATGVVTGSETFQKLHLRGDDTAELSALGGTVAEAIMSITQRRGLNKESNKKIGDSLADVHMSPNQYRKSVETAIRTFGQQIAGDEVAHPTLAGSKKAMLQLIEKSKSNPDAIGAMISDPESWLRTNGFNDQMYDGHENGDTDLHLFRDDSEVP
jgi:hypothetical protein